MLPRTYQDATLERVQSVEARRVITHWLHRLDDAIKLGYGILFHGEFRQGKTACLAVCLMAANAQGRSGLFVRADEIPSVIIEKAEYTPLETLSERLCRVDVLAIDDLGQEKFDERGKAMIERIIRKRYDSAKPMLVSANSLTAIRVAYSGVAQLIEARCECAELRGANWFRQEQDARHKFFI